jgi:chromosome segregation ATPase
MVTTIETDLKEILGEFKQEFLKLNQRLDRIESDLTSLKVSQVEIKGEMETFKAEVKGELETIKAESKGEFSTLKNELAFIREDVKDLKNSQRAQIWALIITVIGATITAVVKFGFFPNP